MRTVSLLGCVVLVSACMPSMKPDEPKTVDDILDEQERIAYENEQDGDQGVVDSDGTLEIDEKAKWDERQSEIELKRAARSAATCHGSIPEEKRAAQPKGEATVELVFAPTGNVRSATISSPFEGTDVGACALRAMKAVIVPNFSGPDHPVTWKVDLSGQVEEPGKKK
ncbi:MAG: hypothetical protein JW751_16880 [Polyangiaceae bacterium]|nr:hypothetical protein [Polyangiaceae bacterium]